MDALPAEMLVDYVRVYQKPTTGIRPLAATAERKSGYLCDLQGRRVINPGKGIYIQDGRKIVIR
jgi:hypothetical protein